MLHLLRSVLFTLRTNPTILEASNAPSGAQRFPTINDRHPKTLSGPSVSMHLLVLSAFRPSKPIPSAPHILSQCTFWCSVLSDTYKPTVAIIFSFGSQCTFWCWMIID